MTSRISQCGYTALGKKALHLLPLEDIYPRYGMPNDFLVTCHIYDMRVMEVPVKRGTACLAIRKPTFSAPTASGKRR